MYDFRDFWEIDAIASKCRGRLILDRPWWAIAGEDYLFVPFAVSIIVVGILGASLGGQDGFGFFLFAGLGTAALLAGFRGIRANYTLSKIAAPGSAASNRARCRAAVTALGWSVVRDNQAFLTATTRASLLSWGRIVAILYDDDAILVSSNAREGPGPIPRSPYAFSSRSASIRALEAQLARTAV